jgi:hypothetical protein
MPRSLIIPWVGFGGPPVPAEELDEILVAEFAVHAWDLAVANRLPEPVAHRAGFLYRGGPLPGPTHKAGVAGRR